MSQQVDRNFDDLAMRFRRNVYGSLKGSVRLKVLERDFQQFIPEYLSDSGNKCVLDVAAGEALFSSRLATHGCELVINDISTEMLNLARASIDREVDVHGEEYRKRIAIVQSPMQQLDSVLADEGLPEKYDLVLCHALLEWMAEPHTLVKKLTGLIKPGGYLSLTFYNMNGLAFKNLLRTNYHKFDIDNFTAFRGSLTPTHPQNPEHICEQLNDEGFSLLCKSGIRVFHDYILDPEQRNRDPEGLIQKELEYSRREPFWQMARYIHYLCRYD
ncbi:methyltransferase domain-containing protein [Teredinibacter haidensis]|uniref:methyltransferase domain-containing protein n=1 Tax=Teredinibacter haidensis TaxID=2731755 RepID=UPI000948FAD8|nr:methyltransferase domain-containing protein [Teredinibacter haidensis]